MNEAPTPNDALNASGGRRPDREPGTPLPPGPSLRDWLILIAAAACFFFVLFGVILPAILGSIK